MDSIGGAKILSERLLRAGCDGAAPGEIEPIAAVDAPPLFHWVGIEPTASVDVAARPPKRLWRRSREC